MEEINRPPHFTGSYDESLSVKIPARAKGYPNKVLELTKKVNLNIVSQVFDGATSQQLC